MQLYLYQNTHFISNKYAPKIVRYVDKYGRSGKATYQNLIWCMRLACWITKAIGTDAEYVILFAFPPQQWLCERALLFRYIYIYTVCLVLFLQHLVFYRHENT